MDQKTMLPPLVYGDFVNREKQRNFLHKTIWQAKPQILLVEGVFGIGKTKLLREFHGECCKMKRELAAVYFDLGKRGHEPNYWQVLFAFPSRFRDAFANFEQAFAEVRQDANAFQQITQNLPAPASRSPDGPASRPPEARSWFQRLLGKLRPQPNQAGIVAAAAGSYPGPPASSPPANGQGAVTSG